MNRKKIIALSILIVFQLSVIAVMFIKAAAVRSYAKKNDTIVRVRCTAYDPFHPLKGRYVQLNLNDDDIKDAENKTGFKLANIQKTADAYYLQEEYALIVDSMNNNDFNELEPVLELYIGKNGSIIQKELYVHHNGAELPIEQYIKDYAL
ncbi:hypothetical protein [Treponema bryantii]|uniref:hypothetical protein n=1 Tax=Treponema bryantii TaxID=163 RepID=UPI002B2EF1D7|nr:hypothetical protein TRBR_05640 [Treponema bryantii]